MRCARVLMLGMAITVLGSCAPPTREDRAPSASFDPDSIPEAFARSTAALMWPGTTRAWQITPEGDLYDGEVVVRVEAASGSTSAPPPRTIAYEGRWLPVAHWWRRSADIEWRFEGVAFPEPAPRDSQLVASLAVTAINRASSARPARLNLALTPPDPDPIFVAFDAPETPTPPLTWGSGGKDTVYAWTDDAKHGASWSTEWTLAPGERRTVRVLLPTYPKSAVDMRALAQTSHARRVEAARTYWTQTLERATHFMLGDPEVEAALEAARVLLLSCRERRGRDWLPIGGPFHYRDIWLRDGARLIAALSVTGHTAEARALAEGFMRFQWPQGAFLSQRGQPDGTGQALWAFEQAMLRPAPAESLSRYVAAARKAWKWYEWQRDFGRQSGWRFGLMLPYADPRDAELVIAQMVGTDAWALAGYRSTARLMRAAGLEQEAAAVDQTRERYMADFVAALDRTQSRDIPPSWQGLGRDWGNLAVGWPCAALPPEHPRLAALAERVWREAGHVGLVTYGHRDSLHGYVGADLGTWALLAGRRAEADSVLEALLHWRNASGAAAEMFSRSADFGRNLPPHPTGAAALVALVRNALIFDDGDVLALTMGARERWWKGAKIERAPTRWGAIDLEFGRRKDEAVWRWTPVPVWTTLTLPPGTVLAGAPSAPLTRRSDTMLMAPPGTREARVGLRPQQLR